MKGVLFGIAVVLAFAQPRAQDPVVMGALDVVVVDRNARTPLADVRVRLEGIGFSGTSDENGRITFESLPAGSYVLHTARAGYAPARHDAVRLPGSSGVPVTVGAGQRTRSELRLVPFGTVSGQVLDSRGRPLPGAVVTPYRYEYDEAGDMAVHNLSRASTNDLGEFRLASLDAATYGFRVEWMTAGEGNAAVLYYPGTSGREQAGLFDVVSGEELRLGVLRAATAPGGMLRARLVNPFGGEGAVARFSLREKWGSFTYEGVSAVDELLMGPMPFGEYLLEVVDSSARMGGAVVAVGPGESGADIRLETRAGVSGQVVVASEGGDLVTYPDRILLTDVTPWRRLRSQVMEATGNGGISIPNAVLPGIYRIEVPDLPPDFYIRSIVVENRDAMDGFAVQGRDIADLRIDLGSSAGAVGGVVVDPSGDAVPLAVVALAPADPAETHRTQGVTADASGRFGFVSLAPGEYRLYAWRELNGAAYRNAEFMQALEGVPVTVTSGSSLSLEPTVIED